MRDLADASKQTFEVYTGTPEWAAIDRALVELAEDKNLPDGIDRPYIAGYLCRAVMATGARKPRKSDAELLTILQAVQEEFKAANPTDRDPVAELLAERREAGARGE